MKETAFLFIKTEDTFIRINVLTLLKEVSINFNSLKDYYRSLRRVLKEYHLICQQCRKKRALHVHHLDKDYNNNSLSNMFLLCPSCHYNFHFPQRENRISPKPILEDFKEVIF